MKKKTSTYLFLWTLLPVLAIALSAKAQENAGAPEAATLLNERLSAYSTEHPASNLYLHLDKNIYSPAETVWFKAYLLADTAMDNKVLYVRITDANKDIVLNGQFPMYDIRGHGDLKLPKKLLEGDYTLYAYTDRMVGYGDTNVFVQPIRIRDNTGNKLEAEAQVADTTRLERGAKVQIMAKLRENGSFAKNVKGEYELVADGKVARSGRLSTNEFGEAFINFTYPQLPDDQALKVNMLFNRDNDYAELTLNLPHEGNPLTVNFHPEGGVLIEGISNKLALEALDIYRNPVSTELLVKDGERIIARTKTDKLGIATVHLTPSAGSRYTVEPATGKKGQRIPFPGTIASAGYGMELRRDKDGLGLSVRNKGQAEDALLVIRSEKEVLWTAPIAVAQGDSASVALPVDAFPKNIMGIALFNGKGKPQGERLFLNKTEEDYKVAVSTDQKDYGTQKKVTVTLNIADAQGNPVMANLSVAATEKNRLDSARYRTILQSWYYRSIGQGRLDRLLSARSAGEMDRLLMAGSWNSGQWNSIWAYVPKGPPPRLENADAAIGMVIHSYKKGINQIHIQSLNKGLSLKSVVQGDLPFFSRVPIRVNGDSTFVVPASTLLSQKEEEWTLDLISDVKLFDGSNSDIKLFDGSISDVKLFDGSSLLVQWRDHDIQFDSTVVKGRLLQTAEPISSFTRFKVPAMSSFSFSGVNQLAAATVGGKGAAVRKLREQCGDRICSSCGRLNCRYRPEFRPVIGKIYRLQTSPKDRTIIYLGCGNYRDINYIKNITIPEEFHLPDYDADPSSKEDLRSTVYWNPNLVTDEDGIAIFSFFTSDVLGDFEINVQGLDVNSLRPLMGTGSFKITTVTGK